MRINQFDFEKAGFIVEEEAENLLDKIDKEYYYLVLQTMNCMRFLLSQMNGILLIVN